MRSNHSVSIGYKTDRRVYISVSFNSKRYRFSNAAAIGQDIYPNRFDGPERHCEAEALQAAFILALRNGWRPILKAPVEPLQKSMIVIAFMRQELALRLGADYSRHYKKDLTYVVDKFEDFLKGRGLQNLRLDELTTPVIRDFLDLRPISNRSKRNFKAYLSTLFKATLEDHNIKNPFLAIKLSRTTEVLHKPFRDVKSILEELYAFDKRLHLCCILAFGCLLRPHREIRELTWEEIADDLSQISLSGARNKGKRNRIVPIPEYVKPYLEAFRPEAVGREANIFTGSPKAYNADFFKTLWGRYKKESKLLEPDQTLYSMRHGGALKVFEQTGSLVKLQQVMGHSSLQVSLTYLRGLEVKQLDVTDMPIFP
jgi:integrase